MLTQTPNYIVAYYHQGKRYRFMKFGNKKLLREYLAEEGMDADDFSAFLDGEKDYCSSDERWVIAADRERYFPAFYE